MRRCAALSYGPLTEHRHRVRCGPDSKRSVTITRRDMHLYAYASSRYVHVMVHHALGAENAGSLGTSIPRARMQSPPCNKIASDTANLIKRFHARKMGPSVLLDTENVIDTGAAVREGRREEVYIPRIIFIASRESAKLTDNFSERTSRFLVFARRDWQNCVSPRLAGNSSPARLSLRKFALVSSRLCIFCSAKYKRVLERAVFV